MLHPHGGFSGVTVVPLSSPSFSCSCCLACFHPLWSRGVSSSGDAVVEVGDKGREVTMANKMAGSASGTVQLDRPKQVRKNQSLYSFKGRLFFAFSILFRLEVPARFHTFQGPS